MTYTRANDRGGTTEPYSFGCPPAWMEGLWFNCDPATGEITKLLLTTTAGGLRLRAFGADRLAPIDWGETPATTYTDRIGSAVITGLTADYDFGFMRTRLAGNIKYGILVIQTYNEFTDGSGRSAYFTREFFSKAVTHDPPPLPPGIPCAALSDLVPEDAAPGPIDPAPFLGRWININPDTVAITHFDLFTRDGSYFLRAHGAGRAEPWGETKISPHAHDTGSSKVVAFLARYDLEFAEVTLAVNENKGILVIAAFHRFTDGRDRADYFTREFFYREAALRG